MSNFENACFLVCDNWVNEIDDTVEPKYSKKHIKKIKEISGQQQKFSFYRKKKFLSVLIPAAIILILSLSTSATVESKTLVVQKGNSDLFNNLQEQNSDFINNNEILSGIVTGEYEIVTLDNLSVNRPEYKPVEDLEYGYIPEGFKETEKVFQWNSFGEIKFSNGTKRFSITKHSENTNITIYPNHPMERFENKGIQYVFFPFVFFDGVHDYYPFLVWNNDGYIYEVSAFDKDVTREELLKIAKDVK